MVHHVVGHVTNQILLDLEASSVGIDQPRQLAEPENPIPRLVAEIHMAEEGQEVVGADGVERDVPDLDEARLLVGL